MKRFAMMAIMALCLFALIKLLWMGDWNNAILGGVAIAGFVHEYAKHEDERKDK